MTKQRKFLPNNGTVLTRSAGKPTPPMPLPAFSNTRPQPVAMETTLAEVSSPSSGTRNLQAVSVHLIDPNPFAPREVYTHQMILERAEDLRTQGQHDPIHVIPHPEEAGRYIICDGWTRVQACLAHKVFDELLAEVHSDLSLQEAAWYGYQQNEGRSQHCDFDRAMFYEKLIADGMSATDVARRAKLDRSMMTFYRAYSKLPSDVLDIVRQHPAKFGARVAYELSKLNEKCGARKTITLAAKFAGEDQPVRWLQAQVQAYLHPATQKSAAPLKHVRYANGYYKQRADGFELSIAVSPEKREAFAQALEELLDTVAVQTTETKAAAELNAATQEDH